MRYQSLAPLFKLAVATLAMLVLLDLLLFRSGLYFRWTEPNSTAGAMMRTLRTIRSDYQPQRRNVLVLGNSRVGEGFSAQLADASDGRDDLHFINGSIAGTTPRAWYYLLREIDPGSTRFAAIALMVDYDVADLRLDMANYALDTPYLLPLLRVSDLGDYLGSFTDAEGRERARRAILLPLQALHEDVQNLLAHPLKRRKVVRGMRRNAAYWNAHYGGRDESLPELQLDAAGEPVDWGADAAQLKPRLEPYFRDLRDKPTRQLQTANAAYLREWLARIAQRYAARGVPVFVFVMPRGPWHESRAPVPVLEGPVGELAARHAVVALPGDAFVSLEQPRFFFDTVHLNRDGREAFSQRFGLLIAARMH